MADPAMTIVWAHGLEGSPTGYKATRLREAGLELIAPDGRGLPLAERVAGLLTTLDAHPGAVLVGSSYGGLASCWVATQRPLCGLVLLAPALHWTEPPVEDPEALSVPPATPFAVIHGVGDTIVPIDVSRRLVSRSPHGVLHEVEDGHALAESLDLIEAVIRGLAST